MVNSQMFQNNYETTSEVRLGVIDSNLNTNKNMSHWAIRAAPTVEDVMVTG